MAVFIDRNDIEGERCRQFVVGECMDFDVSGIHVVKVFEVRSPSAFGVLIDQFEVGAAGKRSKDFVVEGTGILSVLRVTGITSTSIFSGNWRTSPPRSSTRSHAASS